MPTGIRSRPRLLQVLLAVGAVLVLVGAGAVAAGLGEAAVAPIVIAAVLAASLSGWAAASDLRSTEETLAACAAGLALLAGAWNGDLRTGSALPPAVVAACGLALRLMVPTTVTWPLAAWVAAQLAALRTVDAVPGRLHAALFLAVALTGLGIALRGRRPVARAALVTTVPWWTAGVVSGVTTAWTGAGVDRQVAAALVVCAAGGLLLVRLRADLDPLTGPKLVLPVLAGIVAGAGVWGALSDLGTPGVTAAGYVGVLLATTVPELLTGWRRGLFGPVAAAGGGTMALAALVGLSTGAHWSALALLLLLTALPTLVRLWWHPDDRPSAVPTALGCLAAAAVLTVPAGLLRPGTAAALLTVLYGAGLVGAATLAAPSRRPTLVAAGVSAAVAVALVAGRRELSTLGLLLGAQAVLTLGWAGWTAASGGKLQPPSAAWRIGAAQLTLAAEIAAFHGGLQVPEAYSLPLAAGLLLGAGPRLVGGPSWPAWGPGLLVAAVPSGLLAVLAPGSVRPVTVLLGAAMIMLTAGALGVRAPLMIGAGTAVAVALGLAVQALLWPLAGVLAIGAALLAVGARREEFPVAWFGARLAQLR
jgi:hypothetical protein